MGFVARNVYTHVAVCQETQTTFVQPAHISVRVVEKKKKKTYCRLGPRDALRHTPRNWTLTVINSRGRRSNAVDITCDARRAVAKFRRHFAPPVCMCSVTL